MAFETPVLFLIFNRPDTTAKVFEEIRRLQPKYLFVAADGPRLHIKGETEICNQVRSIATFIDWNCDLKTLFREQNLGCGKAPSDAINWFFDQVDEGIILEDDCLPDQSFFLFASELLRIHRNNKKIMSISGCNLGFELMNGESYTYSRFMNMWGWATWANRASKIDYSMSSWRKIRYPKLYLHKKLFTNLFDLDHAWVCYWKEKFDYLSSSINTSIWDWQWVWHQLENDLISIVPAKNMIRNLGFGPHATHTTPADSPLATLETNEFKLPFIFPDSYKINLEYEDIYVKGKWCNYNKISLFKLFLRRIRNYKFWS